MEPRSLLKHLKSQVQNVFRKQTFEQKISWDLEDTFFSILKWCQLNDAVNQSESSCSLAPQTLQLSSPFQMLDIINLRY